MKTIKYNELPHAVQIDIVENIIEKNPFLQEEMWDAYALRELFIDLVEPFNVVLSIANPLFLQKQYPEKNFSDCAVTNLYKTLNKVGELDPVIVSGDTFIDGRHRVEAYCRANRSTIPVVDIRSLLNINWKTWMAG